MSLSVRGGMETGRGDKTPFFFFFTEEEIEMDVTHNHDYIVSLWIDSYNMCSTIILNHY